MSVGVREVRAWLRGRFSDLLAHDVDTILKLFHTNLGPTDSLTGGQFFAAQRLVLHVQSGKPIDRTLAFVQIQPPLPDQPSSRPSSPSKRSSQSQPPPLHPDTPIRRLNHTSPTSPSADHSSTDNPFSPTLPSTPKRTLSTNNPFLTHQSIQRQQPSASPSPQKLPPLPPRKAVPLVPLAPPPRHASLPLPTPNPSTIQTSVSAPAHHSPAVQKSTHVSPLIRQSLQASKAAQSLRKAEEELERERVLSVLKRSNAGSGGSRNRSQTWEKVSVPIADSAATVPPLPRRRNHQVPSPPLSSSGASISADSSLEPVVNATRDQPNADGVMTSAKSLDSGPLFPRSTAVHPSSRPLPNLPTHRISHKRSHTDSASPSISATDATQSVHPPPSHPTRKQVMSTPSSSTLSSSSSRDPSQPSSGSSSPSQPMGRMSRSQSLHHPSPPPIPPPRRKRPESVQLTPTSEAGSVLGANSLFDLTTPTKRGASATVSRKLSLSSSGLKDKDRPSAKSASSVLSGAGSGSGSGSAAGSGSGLTNIQRTIAKFDNMQPKFTLASGLDALQPHLDRARYKAEAGISWRGYLNHHGLAGKLVGGEGEEGEESLINGDEGTQVGVKNSNRDDSEGSDDEGRHSIEADNLKWPAGEGWKPL